MKNVILVGAANTGKSEFHTRYTHSTHETPTTNILCGVAGIEDLKILLIDTPGHPEFREKYSYSWQGMFENIDLIVNFGEWALSEVHGKQPSKLPKLLTWSGDNDETMKRIIDSLQEKCSHQRGYSLDSLWGC